MHVFLITQYFPPEIGAAATRWGDYVKILNEMGHRVTVLCEMPNYPLGKYFPGYKRKWVKIEQDNNIGIKEYVFLDSNKQSIQTKK